MGRDFERLDYPPLSVNDKNSPRADGPRSNIFQIRSLSIFLTPMIAHPELSPDYNELNDRAYAFLRRRSQHVRAAPPASRAHEPGSGIASKFNTPDATSNVK